MTSATAAAARLAGVRPFAHIVARIHAAAIDPRKTVADLATMVERDVSFASRMLRLVNSAGMGLSQRCCSIRHATALLGIKRVAHLATVTAAYAFVEDCSAVAPTLAGHAFAVGGIARVLASYVGLSEDEAFVAGLLHDVGVLLMLQSAEPRYEQLIEAAHPAEPRIEAEAELFGFDHAELGCAAIQGWNLPEPIPTLVRLHHDLEAAADRGAVIGRQVALLRVAELLAPHVLSAPRPNETVTLALAEDPAVARLGISPAAIVQIQMWSKLREAIGAGLQTVPPPLPSLAPPSRVAAERRGAAPGLPTAALADVLEPPAVPKKRSSRRVGYFVAAIAVLAVALGAAVLVARDSFGTTTGSQSHR